MEYSETLKKFAELSREKLRQDTIRQLEAMSVDELSEVLVSVVSEQLEVTDKAHALADRFDDLEEIYKYLRQVYQENYGVDINELEFGVEDD